LLSDENHCITDKSSRDGTLHLPDALQENLQFLTRRLAYKLSPNAIEQVGFRDVVTVHAERLVFVQTQNWVSLEVKDDIRECFSFGALAVPAPKDTGRR